MSPLNNGCLRICNCEDFPQELSRPGSPAGQPGWGGRRLTPAPSGNWPNIITAGRTSSAMKTCASTFSIWPTRRRLLGPPPPSPSMGLSSFMSKP